MAVADVGVVSIFLASFLGPLFRLVKGEVLITSLSSDCVRYEYAHCHFYKSWTYGIVFPLIFRYKYCLIFLLPWKIRSLFFLPQNFFDDPSLKRIQYHAHSM